MKIRTDSGEKRPQDNLKQYHNPSSNNNNQFLILKAPFLEIGTFIHVLIIVILLFPPHFLSDLSVSFLNSILNIYSEFSYLS